MAKQYGKDIAVDFAPEKLMSFGKSFSRLNGQPIDKSEVWYDFSALEAYALTDAAFVGQKVVYVNIEEQTVSHYSIELDGSLKLLGNTDDLEKYIGVIPETSESTTIIDYINEKTSGLANDTAIVEIRTNVENINKTIGEVPEDKTIVEMINDAQTSATYDDTNISNRIKTIEDDYLTSSDKTTLETAITTAKEEAIDEAISTILGENVSADFDTLQEVAAWIQSDTTASSELIIRVSDIEADYLKQSDKTELDNKIVALNNYVGSLPEGSVSTTVIDYVNEMIEDLNIGEYAKASELLSLTTRVNTTEEKITALENIEAEKNIINSVDSQEFNIDENRNLTILKIAMDKIDGLSEEFNKKVDSEVATQNQGIRFINQTEIDKLNKLALEGDSVVVSGTISAGNVTELYNTVVDIVTGIGTGTFDGVVSEKLGVEKGAEVNIIETVKINGRALEVSDKTIEIPQSDNTKMGVVMGSSDENKVSVLEDGTMEVNTININRITQDKEDVLILDGGNSGINVNQ